MFSEEIQPYPKWRPQQSIRAVAIGIAVAEDKLLVMPVYDDQNILKGWRPPGGGIEFGETANEALVREFYEEFGLVVSTSGKPQFLENIYEHEGHTGHEIVIAYRLQITPELASVTSLMERGSQYAIDWQPMSEILIAGMLFPVGLANVINEGKLE